MGLTPIVNIILRFSNICIRGIMSNIVLDKSKAFAIRIVKLYKYLNEDKKEYILSKQVLRSGTSIGANITEAECGFSEKDFLFKMQIAYKECSETLYWLELLYRTDYLTQEQFNSIKVDCEEIKYLLTSITKTTKTKLEL